MERIEEVLDNENVQYDYHENEDGTYYGLVEFWTYTAGQDIPTEFDFDGTAEDFVKEFSKAAENYNVDEEVEVYVNMRGKRGVPNTIRELWDDCQEAKDTLMELAKKLQRVIKEDDDESQIYRVSMSTTFFFNIKANSDEEALDWCATHNLEDVKKLAPAYEPVYTEGIEDCNESDDGGYIDLT